MLRGNQSVQFDLAEPRALELTQERQESRFLWPPLILVIVLLWLVPLGSSLGLDETGNYWVIKDGLVTAAARSNQWSGGQSLLFDALVVAARHIGGDHDFVYRIPSVLAMVLALFFLYKIGTRLAGQLAAMFACLAFASMREVVYVASTLRPYALGLAFVTGAVWALIRWFDSGKRLYGVAYAILAALTIYAHYFLGAMFVVHGIYGLARIRRRDTVVRLRELVVAICLSGAMILPLVPQFMWLLASRAQHSDLGSPTFGDVGDVLKSIVPPLLAGSLALGVLLSIAQRRPITFVRDARLDSGWLLVTWAAAPPLLILLVSLVGDTSIFAGRYYIAAAPGIALLVGALLRLLGPASVRRSIAASVAICAVVQMGVGEHFKRGTTNFRDAVAAVNARVGSSATPVVVESMFSEGSSLAEIRNPRLADVLFAPYVRYPLAGRVVRLPAFLRPDVEQYLDEHVVPILSGSRKFFVIGLAQAAFYRNWLAGRLHTLGFVSRLDGDYGGVDVYIFQREGR
jgi:Dolichyl-phosphate-mannose-protein mannosyltransferase